jgi:predicted RNase H-like HicB family nuclease
LNLGIIIPERERGEYTMREVVIYSGEDRLWVAECPSLSGCVSQGRTREEALTNIRKAISIYIDALKEDSLELKTAVKTENEKGLSLDEYIKRSRSIK